MSPFLKGLRQKNFSTNSYLWKKKFFFDFAETIDTKEQTPIPYF